MSDTISGTGEPALIIADKALALKKFIFSSEETVSRFIAYWVMTDMKKNQAG